MSRPSVVLVVLFAAFLCAPGAAWLAGAKGSTATFENRALHARPKPTFDTLVRGTFGTAFSDWVWDRIPFRPRLLVLDHTVDWYVLRDSPVTSIFVGDGDMLFLKDRTLYGAPPTQVMASVTALERAFAAAGVPLVIAVSPMKGSIYRDKMPPAYRAAFDAVVQPTEEALLKHRGSVIDLWTPIRAARAAGVPVFRNGDTHWNLEAGRIQAKGIVDTIAPGTWREDAAPLVSTTTTAADSELVRIYWKVGPQEQYASLTTQVKSVKKMLPVRSKNGGDAFELHTEPQRDFTPDPRRVVVIHDSFLSEWTGRPRDAQDGGVETLAAFFADTRFIHWDLVNERPVDVQRLLLDADVVVVQVVETNVGNLVRHGPKLVAAARAVGAARKKSGAH